jgi:hypothetical protein
VVNKIDLKDDEEEEIDEEDSKTRLYKMIEEKFP